MQITKPTKAEVMRELKDYVFITFGLISYAMGWAAFLIPYQITTMIASFISSTVCDFLSSISSNPNVSSEAFTR